MKKWIRWWGVAIFGLLGVVVAVFWLFLLDWLVKTGIEEAGSRAVGAKVELADADVSLFPVKLTLSGLQVTNPDSPMTNIVEMEDIRLSVSPGHLLHRRLVSDEMSLAGVRFNTPRKTSGAIQKPVKERKAKEIEAEGKKAKLELPRIDIQDVGSILQKEKLYTLEEVALLKKDLAAEEENVRKMLEELPGKETFQKYRGRVEKLKEGGSIGSLLGAASDVTNLQRDIEKDLNRIKEAKNLFQEKIAAYRDRLTAIQKLPMQDFERLKKKYALTPEGIGNMARLIVGPAYAEWIEKGLYWYEKIKPHLQGKTAGGSEAEARTPLRGKGTDVIFAEEEPVPDLLIRKALATIDTERGAVAGEIVNITSDQSVTGKPTTFRFSGSKLTGLKSIQMNGVIDQVKPGKSIAKIEGGVQGYRIAEFSLAGDTAMPVLLKRAAADADLKVKIEDQRVNAGLQATLSQVKMEAAGRGKQDLITAALAEALSGISNMRVDAEMNGTEEDYDVSVRSDIDKVLKNALTGAIGKQASAFEKTLKQEVLGKTAGPLAEAGSQMGDLGSFSKEFSGRLNMGQDLLGNLKLF